MKVLFLAGFLAICASNAIPLATRDNSHYIEGSSRYLWMTDDEGRTRLEDLHVPVDTDLLATRNGANNQYWLFTRSNPRNPQIITYGNANSVRNSNYSERKPLKVIVHGWAGSGNSVLNTMITSAFLDTFDVNVIVVDWRALASANYITAATGVPSVGQFIGNFVVWLINTAGGNWNNVHFVGFSLGAHAVGVAGRVTGCRPIRVTGLDPAGPLWNTNREALNTAAGRYVEVMHTDVGVMGILQPIGHADFYPNRGRDQPGCGGSNQCSHSRAHELYASSVRTNHFVGNLCSGLIQALNNDRCPGATLNMGNGILTKQGSGIYALRTRSSWPF
ncbi:pancreatic lipase-related protein 2-like [Epargyreus clarus]|uniref:pancreatic lipase-related protein 2-like n=1 Tax=Epargyreus clarus TaxID=520877 RepID=UPI003C2C9EAA